MVVMVVAAAVAAVARAACDCDGGKDAVDRGDDEDGKKLTLAVQTAGSNFEPSNLIFS